MPDAYVITIHPGAPASVHSALGNFIQSDSRILGWWNHLPNVYLLTASCDSTALTASIKPVLQAWPFLVMKVDLDDTQGLLPDQAWDWIQKRVA